MRAALKQRRPEIDHGKRIAALQREIENLMDAIAAGQLRGSAALAKRLTAAEAELERLQARQSSTRRERRAGRPEAGSRPGGPARQGSGRRSRTRTRGATGGARRAGHVAAGDSGRFLWAEYRWE